MTVQQAPAAARQAQAPAGRGASVRARTLVVGAGLLLCTLLALLSLFIGSGSMTLAQSWAALQGEGSAAHNIIVLDYRVPRTILALLVGGALGAAGALIQGITRNPLADPGILGVNAGAYFCVTVGAGFFGVSSTSGQVWCALLGAFVTSVGVYLIGTAGRQGGNPVQLVLAGVAIGAIFSGISHGITLLHPDVFDKVRFWQTGSLQGRQIDVVLGVMPFIIAGLLLAIALSKPLNALALGDDLARSLGSKVLLTRSLGFLAITLLCGAATAAVGPISFLGLMIPHAVRSITGPDQRWVIPLSTLGAPIVFLAADLIGRVIIGSELPVGIVTAFVGAPVLIWLVRRSEAKEL